jgi:hypothetical protein
MGNAILKSEAKKSPLIFIKLYFQIPRGRTPRRLGLLVVDFRWEPQIEEQAFSRIHFGMFAEPSKTMFFQQLSNNTY